MLQEDVDAYYRSKAENILAALREVQFVKLNPITFSLEYRSAMNVVCSMFNFPLSLC
jgi:ABC-type Fe2+-enterobactin transport system substrate-binding protein